MLHSLCFTSLGRLFLLILYLSLHDGPFFQPTSHFFLFRLEACSCHLPSPHHSTSNTFLAFLFLPSHNQGNSITSQFPFKQLHSPSSTGQTVHFQEQTMASTSTPGVPDDGVSLEQRTKYVYQNFASALTYIKRGTRQVSQLFSPHPFTCAPVATRGATTPPRIVTWETDG